nr:hypothetical protein HmN_000968000 [Hymenolepis microstoma]
MLLAAVMANLHVVLATLVVGTQERVRPNPRCAKRNRNARSRAATNARPTNLVQNWTGLFIVLSFFVSQTDLSHVGGGAGVGEEEVVPRSLSLREVVLVTMHRRSTPSLKTLISTARTISGPWCVGHQTKLHLIPSLDRRLSQTGIARVFSRCSALTNPFWSPSTRSSQWTGHRFYESALVSCRILL